MGLAAYAKVLTSGIDTEVDLRIKIRIVRYIYVYPEKVPEWSDAMQQPKSERFEMRLDPDLLERVDGWRRKEQDFPSRAESIRRLIERGLEQDGGKHPKLSDGERLMTFMLCEIMEKIGAKREIDPDFVSAALLGGHYWGLKWKYDYVFHSHADSEKTVREVVDIIDMWDFIESGFKKLSSDDAARVKADAAPFGDKVSFPGFDGNNESEYASAAAFLIEKLERFSRFRSRAHLNSHMPTLTGYRRMVAAFLPIRATLTGGELSASQIITVLNARRVS